jgi:hypothetical protein
MNKSNTCLRSGLLFLAFCFLASASGLLHAGAPLKINFQGRLEESGQPAEGAKNFVFKIYDSLSGGSLVWTSQAQSVPVTSGVFSVVLEAGTPVNLSTAAFAGARFVEITVDGVPLSPRQEMASAPYSLVAQSLAPDAVIALSNLEKDPSSASVINTATNAVDWTQLKNVPAGLADGTDDGGAAAFSTAAIVSGKFSDERVSITTGAFYGGFNAASQLVQLEASGNLPVLDGSALINVNSAPMSALTAQVNNVAASTGTLTVNLAAVVLSTGPLANSGNWNTAYGWGDHGAAGYASGATLGGVITSTGTIAADLAAETTARSGADSALTTRVDSVAASTGTLTVNLAAVVLSTGPLANSGSWSGALSAGGPISLPIKTLTEANRPYTVTGNDSTILVDASAHIAEYIINLPSAVGIAGRIYTFKRVDDPAAIGALPVTITPALAQTVDGVASLQLIAMRWVSVAIQSDGSNWFILSAYDVGI